MVQAKKYSKIHVEISNVCNLQCSFCPEVLRTKTWMDVSLFARIVAQIHDLTDQITFHLMGDPLVHPKLAELVQICEDYHLPIQLVTNGLLLRGDKIELLLKPIFRQINFSLHSFPNNFKDKDPTLYLQNIFSFTERALKERPELYINYRLWNLQDPTGFAGPNESMVQKVVNHFNPEVNLAFDVKRHKSIKLLGRLYLHFETEFTWPSLELPVIGEKGTCYGLKSHFGILADGTVVPCCLDKEGNIPLGRVQDSNIREILGSSEAQDILKGFQQRKLVNPLCQRCNYIERFR